MRMPFTQSRSPRHTMTPRGPHSRARGGPYRRVLLINPPMEMIGAEFLMDDIPIRLEYLAAYIRPHVEDVVVLDLTVITKPLEYFLKRFAPDLVGIGVNYVSVHKNAQALAGIARRFGADVVVGGYEATALAEEFATHPDVDVVVRGEGEATLLELVQGRPLDEIEGISFVRDGVVTHTADRDLLEDLDTIPFPERERRIKPPDSPFMDLECDGGTAYDMIITSRGCWGTCKFCTEPIMSRGTQRYRKPEKVIEELEQLVKLHLGKKRLRVSISDPNFGGNPRIAEELCDQLIEFRRRSPIDLHFFISVRTSTIATRPRLVEKMTRAGMDYVFVGMESPRAEDLKEISKGGGGRAKQEQAAKLLNDNGAAVMSCFLMGIPGQTEDDILSMVDYAKGLELTDCYFSIMTPLPGSRLYDEARESGELLETDPTKYKLWDMVIKHDKVSRSKMRELCIRCNAKWYDDLLLKQEYRRWQASGRKKKLHVYSKKFRVLAGFFGNLGTSATSDNASEFADLDPATFVMDMPNPELRRFTEQTGVHNILEMRRFLKLLGKQKLQVSLQFDGRESVSWVMKTNGDGVEYVDAIEGSTDDPTIAINIPLNNGGPTARSVLVGMLRDNPGLKSRINLARLVTATGSEVLAGVVDGWRETLRYKTHRLFS
jgi:anaerobic magnesium-protoporphyrin IX monomethyl ester cyclase